MNIRFKKYKLLILVPVVIALVYLLIHLRDTDWFIETSKFFEVKGQQNDRNETSGFSVATNDVYGESSSTQRGKPSFMFPNIPQVNGSRAFDDRLSDGESSYDATSETLPKHSVIETTDKEILEIDIPSGIAPIPSSSKKTKQGQEISKVNLMSKDYNYTGNEILPTSRDVTMFNSVQDEEYEEFSASSTTEDNPGLSTNELQQMKNLQITTPTQSQLTVESQDMIKTDNLTKTLFEESPIDCPYTASISNTASKVKSNCQAYFRYFDPCKDASSYFNSKTFKNLPKCTRKQYKPICHFTIAVYKEQMNESDVICSNQVCASEITVKMLDEATGKTTKVNTVTSVNALKELIILLNGKTNFIFVSCKPSKNEKRRIRQLIKFPSKVLTSNVNADMKSIVLPINVNVFVIDSLSRQHFFRILPNTAKAMNEINSKDPTKILDFQAFQSLAPFTFVNLHAFFSGSVMYDSVATRRYNFQDLYRKFQQSDYQTLLQEDTCWYDQWGSLLTGNSKLKSKSTAYQQKIWDEISSNVTSQNGVDSLGMTHMSCEVLTQYGNTNLYNSKPIVCLNGKPMSTYFIQEIIDHLRARSSVQEAKPLFSYTHINFAHETSGMRIKVIDTELANFVTFLSQAEDTISILWSDHGGKTNQYSMDTLSGRFEVYDPFLFMIIPNSLKSILSKNDFEQLLNNQESLFTPLDLRATLLDMLNEINDHNNNNNNNNNNNIKSKFKGSLLSTNLANRRNCSFLSTRNYSLCKCINELTFPEPTDSRYKDFLGWLAEFAIGAINNKLTNQQVSSKQGYKCNRLIGEKIEKVLLRATGKGNVYIFDIVVRSKTGHKDIFNVHVFHNAKRIETMPMLKLTFWQRISFYSRYKSCADPMVSIELCVCTNSQTYFNQSYLASYSQFGTTGVINNIEKHACLFLIKRDQDIVVSYEVANFCKDEKVLTFYTDILFSWEVAEDLPIKIIIGPSKLMFITTFYKLYKGDENIQVKIEVE